MLAEWGHPDRHGHGDKKWNSHSKKEFSCSFPNQTMHLSYDPWIAFLHIYHRERTYFHSGTNILMFIAVLFIIANSEWMNSVSEWLNELYMVHLYHEILFSKKKEQIISVCNNLDDPQGTFAEWKNERVYTSWFCVCKMCEITSYILKG